MTVLVERRQVCDTVGDGVSGVALVVGLALRLRGAALCNLESKLPNRFYCPLHELGQRPQIPPLCLPLKSGSVRGLSVVPLVCMCQGGNILVGRWMNGRLLRMLYAGTTQPTLPPCALHTSQLRCRQHNIARSVHCIRLSSKRSPCSATPS
jgi:hypothetical protein